MLEDLHLLLLGIIQGLTEFLPISSSAHLVLLPILMDWPDQGLSYDVAAHAGSLLAILLYLRQDLIGILTHGVHSIRQQRITTQQARLFWLLILATLPALVVGFLARDLLSLSLRQPFIIGVASIGFGLLLWWADQRATHHRTLASISIRDALVIGCAQVLAIIPGTSRSGITMTAGLWLNLDRVAAARFSFLLAVPIISLASLYEGWQLWQSAVAIDLSGLLLVASSSAAVAWLTIHYFLRWVTRVGFLPFVLYRIVVGLWLCMVF